VHDENGWGMKSKSPKPDPMYRCHQEKGGGRKKRKKVVGEDVQRTEDQMRTPAGEKLGGKNQFPREVGLWEGCSFSPMVVGMSRVTKGSSKALGEPPLTAGKGRQKHGKSQAKISKEVGDASPFTGEGKKKKETVQNGGNRRKKPKERRGL